MKTRKAQTLQKPVTYSGIGVHTGEIVEMTFVPAAVGTGIVFRKDGETIPARADYVVDTSRSTTIGNGNTRIHTVEHVLAALFSYRIDNLIIEISNIEPPIGNGGSDHFVEMIEEAGIIEQNEEIEIVSLQEPIFFQKDVITLVALPYEGFKVSYTLHYPGVTPIEAQYFELEVTPEGFKKEIAPCRTFSLYNEVSYLLDKGLIRGASLSNGVVVCEKAILSKEGLHFNNEMARHKILDLIGDLALLGFSYEAHIVAIRSGHATNVAFAKTILQKVMSYDRIAHRY